MQNPFYSTLLRLGLICCLSACQPAAETAQQTAAAAQTLSAQFDWFAYQGRDPVFAVPVPQGQYQNPVLAGFFPDPSITRNGDDYYMTVSSFTYTPGLPILHSRDLVNWQIVGYALTRESQLQMHDLQVSRGIFAPTLRYHNGTYYLITTVVDRGGNFILTASDPTGPWSDPIWLPEVEGIDPDIFFDDDGKVYIAHNSDPVESLYEGHKAIWLWQYDPAQQKIVPGSQQLLVNGGVDLSTKPIWIEAPHLYKHDGWYYLLCAEGGTADQHSAVIFRSRSLSQPFVPYSGNPILTQRDLAPERPDPITTAGHADFVQLPDNSWWAVFLASRAYQQRYFNTGRETFLLPVSWQDGWPHILPAGEAIPYRLPAPALAASPLAEPLSGNFSWRDEFNSTTLSLHWNSLRSFDQSWLTLDGQQLSLQAKAVDLDSLAQPAFIARRQQHTHFDASTSLTPPPATASAGLVAFQNEQHHYYLGVRNNDSGTEVFLEQASGSAPQQIASLVLPSAANKVQLKISGSAGNISFYYAVADNDWQPVARDQDAMLLSTQVAGGFVGTMLGLHSRLEPRQ
ncbi:MAG: glycoside hydrolase family 43 protein [Gammaproteobacteria bacterium]|nr:glycoside hydrolase family 43 protein [Gammaproteobacteria bacterium]MBU1554467.1 glycoside hydrolase family 43 protein [Gammaproteobacteria bacterium]MBU2070709.1 glycoside hydrolase family 43 protein [Gammaproteobacteria bacterium]MBU2184197.1 glycoside hydrolase family 43 protein [Gammaproteobacteria bacterium]MBU2206058.1 glycoside hydrolase family 43 protein [Gammaproteobacteria bacterium]